MPSVICSAKATRKQSAEIEHVEHRFFASSTASRGAISLYGSG